MPARILRAMLLATALSTAPAWAGQQQDDGAGSGLEEIVVTAQKRSEKLQDVPVTVNTQTATMLKAADIRSTTDLTQVVPGLRANVQLSFFQPFIRGVGGTSTLRGNEAPVAIYVDGFYVASKAANTTELNNIERIEVLKGPQGTLFGRNATGGALNVITRAPSTGETEIRADASYGRYEDLIANGYLSGPLGDTLSASAAIRYQHTGKGYQRNVITGSDLGRAKNFSGMVKLRWEPVDDLVITNGFTRTYRYNNDDEQATPNIAIRPKGALVAGAPISYTPFRPALNTDPAFRYREIRNVLDARYDLGFASLVSITGYLRGKSFASVERDRSGAPLQINFSSGVDREVTQELQLVSEGGKPFSWILGAYYFNNRESNNPNSTLLNIPGQGTLADLASVNGRAGVSWRDVTATQYAKSYAGFAEGTYKLTDTTRLTAGLRYTTEKRRLIGLNEAITAPAPGTAFVRTTLGTVNERGSFNRATWRLTLDHHFTDDVMGYISYNRGFRSGAFNTTSIAPQRPLRPEVIDAYEGGLKTELFDRRLRLNGAVFYYDYRDLHVSIRQPATGVIIQQNAGKAEIYGLDLDFAANPIEHLTLSGGFNYLHARYKEFLNASTFVIDTTAGGGRNATIADAKGEVLSYAPKFTTNLTAQYDIPLSGGGRIGLNGNIFYTTKVSRQVGNVLGREEIQGYETVNGSITWYAPEDRYFVRAWGRNLTNHKVLGSSLDSFAYFYLVQRPITYGMTVGICFGGRC